MDGKSASRPKVSVKKTFNAAPEKVFDAWLNPEILSRWMFGPEVRDEEIVSLKLDSREGGTFSFVVRRDDEVLNHLGTYLEIDGPQRLVFTWGVESASEGESVVTVEIEPTENGCRLALTHELDPKWKEYQDRTKEGWTYMLSKLKEVIELHTSENRNSDETER